MWRQEAENSETRYVLNVTWIVADNGDDDIGESKLIDNDTAVVVNDDDDKMLSS